MNSLDRTPFNKTSNTQDLTTQEAPKTPFNPNNNQLITYMWTSLPTGPKCRIKYTITPDICTSNKGSIGVKCMFF